MALDPDVATAAADLVSKLAKLPKGTVLKRYITHIRFPLFKNLEPDARLELDFPVTALVGANGSGKTSALTALYGAPKGMTSSDFWFATEVDPIKEGSGEPNRFIYGHWLDGQPQPVETRKARVRKKTKPGYFEPTKAVAGDAMDLSPFPLAQPVPGAAKDRWLPVERELIYINFRSEIGAFDKYLFWADPKPSKKLRTKHDRLQLGAKRLKPVIDKNLQSASLFGREAIKENRPLSETELEYVSYVLGKSYSAARLIRHRYYGGQLGTTVVFSTSKASYTEAFAGSGELAVASLVVKLMAAENYSLVLLDEPEVSLHPGAQERLLILLLDLALKKKLQIIFTTHSPPLIRHLPENAIKVFHETPSGKFGIINSAHPFAAFHRIGAAVPAQLQVFVEDRLAEYVVGLALQNMPEGERELFSVEVLPGGATGYLANRIPNLMLVNPLGSCILLDGDRQLSADSVPDPKTIPKSGDKELAKIIQKHTDVSKPAFNADGGDDPSSLEKLHSLERTYLEYLRNRVRYLPRSCPEQIVLSAVGEPTYASSQAAKDALEQRVKKLYGEKITSADIDTFARAELAKVRIGNSDLGAIIQTLRELLKSAKLN